MSWAKPVVSVKIGPSPATKRDHMMAATIYTNIISPHKDNIDEQNVNSTPKCHSKKRTLKESMFDKENMYVTMDKEVLKPPAKRMLLEKDTTRIKTSKGKVKPNRKQIKLLQGQRQLTNFFR